VAPSTPITSGTNKENPLDGSDLELDDNPGLDDAAGDNVDDGVIDEEMRNLELQLKRVTESVRDKRGANKELEKQPEKEPEKQSETGDRQ